MIEKATKNILLRSCLAAGLIYCAMISGAFAADGTAANATAAQVCVARLMAGIDTTRPETDDEKAAFANCYTSNGVSVPAPSKPLAISPEQTAALGACIVAHGGTVPTADNQSQLTHTDYDINRACIQSLGIARTEEEKIAAETAIHDKINDCVKKAGRTYQTTIDRCFTDNGLVPPSTDTMTGVPPVPASGPKP